MPSPFFTSTEFRSPLRAQARRALRAISAVGLVVAGALASAGCIPTVGMVSMSCTPGRAEGCSCADGRRGVQICASSGNSFGECMCSTTTNPATCGAEGGDCCNGGGCNAGLTCHLETATAYKCRRTPCGGVGLACCFDGTSPVCNGGAECDINGLARCQRPGAMGCDSGQTNCSGSCVVLATDRYHCGACGNVCNADQVCSQGACMGGMTSEPLIGAACVDASQCNGAGCVPESSGFPGGYCTGRCTDHPQCGSQGVCLPTDSMGNMACFAACVPNTSGHCRAGYVCMDVTTDHTVGICYPDCRMNDVCSTAANCNPSTGACENPGSGG